MAGGEGGGGGSSSHLYAKLAAWCFGGFTGDLCLSNIFSEQCVLPADPLGFCRYFSANYTLAIHVLVITVPACMD